MWLNGLNFAQSLVHLVSYPLAYIFWSAVDAESKGNPEG